MTESEWRGCQTKPAKLFHFIKHKTSSRKVQLISCGVCGLLNHNKTRDILRQAIHALERLAEDNITEAKFVDARTLALNMVRGLYVDVGSGLNSNYISTASFSIAAAMNPDIRGGCSAAIYHVQDGIKRLAKVGEKHIEAQRIARQICAVIHEVIGNPFQKWSRTAPWSEGGLIQPDGRTVALTDTVRGLAETIHQLQAFDRLPILADALEEAGITDIALLAHCRSEQPHIRGCWALDVVRGKT